MKISEIVNNLSSVKLLEFDRTTNAFNFVFEKDLKANETIIVKMPPVSANKRGINDIGWLSDGNVTLYGTLAKNPRNPNALCQEIRAYDEVNKVTSAIIVVNNGDACRIEMRAIFN
jgi:hypothetical protein